MKSQIFDPLIYTYSADKWASSSASIINGLVMTCLSEKGRCSVMLTGGKSASEIYLKWKSFGGFKDLSGVEFYFSDERCVPPDDSESNYNMVINSLFDKGLPEGSKLCRIQAELQDKNRAAKEYSELMPIKIDILLLSMGVDGHIASIFPGDYKIFTSTSKFEYVPSSIDGPRVDRISITPTLISSADKICLLIRGSHKKDLLNKISKKKYDPINNPSQLIKSGIWLMDKG